MPIYPEWGLNQQNLITFVLVDASGAEVTGLGNTFTLNISKAGGAFVGSAGTKTEIGNGWYAYLGTAGEADTVGPVSIRITGAGIVQQNLEYVVVDRNLNGINFTYTITDSVTTNPISGVSVSITTDAAGNNVVWNGTTNTFGIARDTDSSLPFLDAGTYYFFSRKAGYYGTNPDTVIVAVGTTSDARTLTAVTSGVAVGLGIAQPIPYTLLSLDRYAKIMGINPAHFWTAYAPDLDPQVFPLNNRCSNIWPHYSWQASDQVSHYDLALAIKEAEDEIAKYINFWPAPKWIAKEMHAYPRHYNRQAYDLTYNVRDQLKSVIARWGKVISPGQRAVSLLGTATIAGGSLTYSDEDSDGLAETATVQMSTTLTDANEINVYFSSKSGAQDWEIREARSKSISGGVWTGVYDSWLFIDPDTRGAFPTGNGFTAINISTTANYVSTVDVYREYTDTTAASAQLIWERQPGTYCTTCGGIGCEACSLLTQDGCVHIRDVRRGLLVPQAAEYDATNGYWVGTALTECREPDQVKIWYYAGDQADEYLSGYSHLRLSNFWAQTIAYLATARLERQPCDCSNITAVYAHLRADMAESVGDVNRFMPADKLLNPLGTKRGEVIVWDRISKFSEKIARGYAI